MATRTQRKVKTKVKQTYRMKKVKSMGCVKEEKPRGPLSVVATVPRNGLPDCMLATDGHLYEKTGGHLHFLRQVSKEAFRAAWGETSEGRDPELLGMSPGVIPSDAEIKGVFESFFAPSKKERMIWYGKCWKDIEYPTKGAVLKIKRGQIVWWVPKQVVSGASVEVEDHGLTGFLTVADPIGNIHSHPWKGMPSMSGTDDRDMKVCPGLHGIISGEGDMRWYASTEGAVVPVCSRGKEVLQGVKGAPTLFFTKGGAPWVDLIEEKKPPKTSTIFLTGKVPTSRSKWGQSTWDSLFADKHPVKGKKVHRDKGNKKGWKWPTSLVPLEDGIKVVASWQQGGAHYYRSFLMAAGDYQRMGVVLAKVGVDLSLSGTIWDGDPL